MKIMHVITCLGRGGAPLALLRLSKALQLLGHEQQVIALRTPHTISGLFEQASIACHLLHMERASEILHSFRRVRQLVHDYQPAVVQGWMYHANFVSSLCLPKGSAMAWNIRHTPHDSIFSEEKSALLGITLNRLAPKKPRTTIYCSERSRQRHQSLGFGGPSALIHNGYTVPCLLDDPPLPGSAEDRYPRFLIVGRFHPMKNQAVALNAFRDYLHAGGAGTLTVVGRDWQECLRSDAWSGLVGAERIVWLGEVDDVGPIYRSHDCLLLTSRWGESFPNVVAEAMLHGLWVISSDVGGAAEIIGHLGKVVTGFHASDFVASMLEFQHKLHPRSAQLTSEITEYAKSRYGIDTIARSYDSLYAEITGGVRKQ